MKEDGKRLLDDFAKLAGSTMNTVMGAKGEVEKFCRQQCEAFFSKMDLVKREEFEIVKAMATKAREEQEKLQKRLDKLEGKKPAAKKAASKPAAKKPAKKAAKKSTAKTTKKK